MNNLKTIFNFITKFSLLKYEQTMKENTVKKFTINDDELYNLTTNKNVEKVFSLPIKDYSKFGFYYDFKNNETKCFKCGFSYSDLLKPYEFQKIVFFHLTQNLFDCKLKEGHNRYLKYANENNCLDLSLRLLPVVEQFLKYNILKKELKTAEYYADESSSSLSQKMEPVKEAKKNKTFK